MYERYSEIIRLSCYYSDQDMVPKKKKTKEISFAYFALIAVLTLWKMPSETTGRTTSCVKPEQVNIQIL